MSAFLQEYYSNIIACAKNINQTQINTIVQKLIRLRKRKGRLILIGIGGSLANCSHAVNDFRKLCNIDAYTPVDNISEITAKTNDEGFETIFDSYLRLTNFCKNDLLMIFSVGGGHIKKNVSVNLIRAIKFAKSKKGKTVCIVGKSDGYAYKNSDISILVNVYDKKLVTPVSETFQTLIWHLLVSHPQLQINKTKW